MSKQATVWSIVIIVLIVILGLIIWSGNDGTEVSEPADNDNTGEVSGIVGENELEIVDQVVGTRTVTAASVFLENPGYIAIHGSLADGTPGAVLGSSELLPAGQSRNVSIPLSSGLVADRDYIAMLHIDNGDGTFNAAADLAARDSGGNEVRTTFESVAGQ